MSNPSVTQLDIDTYVATRDEFWHSFHESLSDPFSEWQSNKGLNFEQWVALVWNSPNFVENLKFIFQYPLIKGEYFISYYQGFFLTNYRLLINDASVGKPSIPLPKLLSYNADGEGTIEFEKNGVKIALSYSKLLKESLVLSVKARSVGLNLSDKQLSLIAKSSFDLTSELPDLKIPRLEMYPLSEEQKDKIIETNNLEKDKTNSTSSGRFSGIGHKPALLLSIGFILFLIFGDKSGWGDRHDSLTSLYLTELLPSAIVGFIVIYLIVRGIFLIFLWLLK